MPGAGAPGAATLGRARAASAGSGRQSLRRGVDRRCVNGVYARGRRRAWWPPRNSGGSATRGGPSDDCWVSPGRPGESPRVPPAVRSGRIPVRGAAGSRRRAAGVRAAASVPTVTPPPRRPGRRPDPFGVRSGRERSPCKWRCKRRLRPLPDSGQSTGARPHTRHPAPGGPLGPRVLRRLFPAGSGIVGQRSGPHSPHHRLSLRIRREAADVVLAPLLQDPARTTVVQRLMRKRRLPSPGWLRWPA